jgi:demethylmenaquinone methyltransferase/2-methoxy-6-polyprenyl-1,4-benzoquinol methylase
MSASPIIPYEDLNLSKKEQVRNMFNKIAPRYDFLNHVLTFNIDVKWRKKAVKLVKPFSPKQLLDIGTGTGDFAIEMARILSPEKVIGIDIATTMLELGRKKIQRKGLDKVIEMQEADSENLPFSDNSFDATGSAFGVRNFENLEKGLSEMLRVLRPDGHILILEASDPKNMPLKGLYKAYMNKICPAIGGLFSENKAYSYLNRSVAVFPAGTDFTAILEKIGFIQATCIPMIMGVASIYIAKKPGIAK